MVGKDNSNKGKPVFIPPRKRQSSKKTNGTQNYVDHIVTAQTRQQKKLSPSSPGLEDDLVKTSLLLKNKQPLPQLPKEATTITANNSKIITTSHDNIYESEDNELKNLHPPSLNSQPNIRNDSTTTTVTPNSCYSESSLDTKLNKSHDCLAPDTRSVKKRVNIRTDILQSNKPRKSSPTLANYEDLESGETSVLNTDEQNSLDRYNTRRSMDSYLTMTGTIKRGRKKGQSVDLQVNISREELEKINAIALSIETKKSKNLFCVCNLTTGFHIFLLSLICLPFVTLTTSIYSFYIGTLTWYNMFNYFNEEKSYLYKFIMSPILILAYPIGILFCTLGLGVYAGGIQLSLQLTSWLNEIADIEKGFYGWLCGFLQLSDCSPYEVVILTELHLPENQPNTNSSTEELSL